MRTLRLRHPALAAAGVAIVLAGAGTAAANDWVEIFESRTIVPLRLDATDLVALPDLDGYGDVAVTQPLQVRRVDDAAEAVEATGLAAPEVSELPRGVDGEPTYRVAGPVSATFTFSAEQARRANGGKTPIPPELDGSRVRFDAGPAVVAVWAEDHGVPSLLIGRAVVPTAAAEGASFDAIREYLLSAPGVPAELAQQLRELSPDGTSLPLPVPSDRIVTSDARVGAATATVLATRDGAFAAVMWLDGGVVTVVAGPLSTDEVVDVANALR